MLLRVVMLRMGERGIISVEAEIQDHVEGKQHAGGDEDFAGGAFARLTRAVVTACVMAINFPAVHLQPPAQSQNGCGKYNHREFVVMKLVVKDLQPPR